MGFALHGPVMKLHATYTRVENAALSGSNVLGGFFASTEDQTEKEPGHHIPANKKKRLLCTCPTRAQQVWNQSLGR